MNKKYLKYLAVVGLTLAFFATSYGQGPGDNLSGMLRAELERTDQLIEYAMEAVRVSSSVRAELALENAKQLQEQAWEEFDRNTEAGFRLAGPLTRQAREQAKSALSSARYTLQKQDVVLRKLERANEILQRTKEQLSTRQRTEALMATYESAEDNLRNAWEFYRNGEYRPALKLAIQVENAIRRLVAASNREARSETGIERYAETVDQILTQARQQIAECNSETSMKLLEEARVSMELARTLMDEEKPQPAMEALKTAKKLATRARLECSGFDGTLSERYERIRNDADEIAEMVSSDDEAAQQLLNQVYEQLNLAAGYIDEGRTEEAAASLKAAQLTLNQIVKLLDVSTE